MKRLTLEILKEDLNMENYLNSKDCPIARACKRKGFTYVTDAPDMLCFIDKKGGAQVFTNKNSNHEDLEDKAAGCACGMESKKSFKFTLKKLRGWKTMLK